MLAFRSIASKETHIAVSSEFFAKGEPRVKASVMTAYGGPEVMKYQDMPDPALGAGDVLVKAAGIGINPEDMLERNGDLKDRFPLHFPAIIGLDVSGTVVATGDGVSDPKVGERVCGWSYHTYAELVADKAILFAKVPETMDLVDAAAIPLVGLTGSQLISVASGLRPGQTVLVSGAAGAVGRCAVYMARVLNARVIAGVLRSQLDQADSIGADETVALDDPAAFAKIPQVDVIANTLRGKPATDLLAKVKDGGTFASVTGAPEGAQRYPNVRVVPFRSKQDRAGISFIADAVNARKMTIPIGRREELKNAGDAQAAFTKGGIGKVLLTP
jgi:NADPH:quinone reductase-like Zn-dependent oxidoreductase